MTRNFEGLGELVAGIDGAIAAGGRTHDVTARIREHVCRAIRSRALVLPDALLEPCATHYARRAVHHSVEHGYSVVAMVWSPLQGTPIHDHAGLWCVEAVYAGELEVLQFARPKTIDGARTELKSAGAIRACRGSAVTLIPPHEHHAVRNVSETEVAVTLNVYAAAMDHCAVFVPADATSFRTLPRRLAFD